MKELWDKISNEFEELSRLYPAVEIESIKDYDAKDLLEYLGGLRKAISDEKASLKEKLEKAENDFQQLWEMLDSKNAETEMLDQRSVQAEEEQKSLRELAAEANDAVTVLEQTKKELQAANEEIQQENARLLRQLQEVEKELETLSQQQQELIAAAKANAENNKLIEEYEKQNQQLVQDMELYEKNNQQLRHEIATMQQSWTWLMTAPLRFLSGGSSVKKKGADKKIQTGETKKEE
jgi:chromosome segregation ATPase